MNKALILLSGGQDSTTCLYWAKEKFDSIQAIGFNYGQRHLVELDFAKKICDKEDISFDIISLKEILSNSALINPHLDLMIIIHQMKIYQIHLFLEGIYFFYQ